MALGDVYEKTAPSTWTKRATIVGATGPQGPVGPQGAAEGWYSGSGAPAGALGAQGDWYLDTDATYPFTPSYVTSLPSSPVDGTEVYYAADQVNGIVWHLRYRAAASGSYKWEFLGGSPLRAVNTSLQQTGSTSYVDLTGGPQITVPLAGEYDVDWSMHGAHDVATGFGLMAIKNGAAAAADIDAAFGQSWGAVSRWTTGQSKRFTVTAAATILKAQYRSGGGGNVQINYSGGINSGFCWMEAQPVRVG